MSKSWLYVQLNIDTELGDIPVTGNLGVRMVESEQASTVLQNVAEAVVDENGELLPFAVILIWAPSTLRWCGFNQWFLSSYGYFDSYMDYLPSLNLSFQISDNEQVRIAAAKVMGLPPINRLFVDASTCISRNRIIDPDTNQLVGLETLLKSQARAATTRICVPSMLISLIYLTSVTLTTQRVPL